MAHADAEIIKKRPEELLTALRQVAVGEGAAADDASILDRAGLARNSVLTRLGRDLHKKAWVLQDRAGVNEALHEILRPFLPIQVIDQELRGFGAVPEAGVVELLRVHRAIPDGFGVDKARPFFRWANDIGLIKYSRRDKTVRSTVPDAASAKLGEDRRLAAAISPRTPLLNVVRIRRILRTMEGMVWWADPHFGRRALEELAEELNPEQVSEVRILSGSGADVLNERAGRDFKRFSMELSQKGVETEWRVDHLRDWHDRFLLDPKGGYNVPPINTLFKGDYSEILPVAARPPVEDWWDRGRPWPPA